MLFVNTEKCYCLMESIIIIKIFKSNESKLLSCNKYHKAFGKIQKKIQLINWTGGVILKILNPSMDYLMYCYICLREDQKTRGQFLIFV